MSLAHGRQQITKLDDLAGVLTDSSIYFDSVKYSQKTDRANTPASGDVGMRRGATGLKEATISFGGYAQIGAGTNNRLHGKSTRMLLDQYAFHGTLQKASLKMKADRPNTEVYEAWKRHGVLGLIDTTISLNGQFDDAAGMNYAVLTALLESDPASFSVMDFAPNGYAAGNLALMYSGVAGQLDIDGAPTKVVDVSGNLMSDGEYDLGISLRDIIAEVGGGAVNYASIDELAATARGGVGHLHVLQLAGPGANVTYKIQHSVDNAVWVDLITFANMNAVGSQRIEIPDGTAVNRYVRAIISAGAYTSVTAVPVFGRRGFTFGAIGTLRYLFGLLKATASTTFEAAPGGTAVGRAKKTGEAFLTDLSVELANNAVSKMSGTFVSDGPVSSGTY